MIIRAIVIDDEELARQRLHNLLRRMPGIEVVGLAGDGVEGLALIERERPDLVFLDVGQPGLSGPNVLATLPAPRSFSTIVVSALAQHAAAAFDLAAADYLLKPIESERLGIALERVREHIEARDALARIEEMRQVIAALRASAVAQAGETRERVIWVGAPGLRVAAPVAGIEWVQADGDYVRLHCGARTYLLRQSLTAFLSRLDPDRFVRTHRSAAVAVEGLKRVRRDAKQRVIVELASGAEIAVSRRYVARIMDLSQPRHAGWSPQIPGVMKAPNAGVADTPGWRLAATI